MEIIAVFFVVTTIGFGVLACVFESKYISEKKALNELRSDIEHDERDEILRSSILKECDKRIVDHTFSVINAHEMEFHE